MILDDASDAFSFYIGADYLQDIWNRVEITPNKQQLVHVKMKLSNCINTADLQYINTQNTEMVTLYTESSNEDIINGNYFNYDNVNYVQPSTFHLCPPPTIVDFMPKTISSGTNSVLTIEGYGFGNERGIGQIYMKNDVNGSITIKAFDYIDYISWSDSLIEFKIPSVVDTLADSSLIAPGSGKFSIYK
ncbi:MAG: IPT/TIG domain-containing protein [Brumimicrobium sp.]|nr:IPT/TIG domain-containing protein [Brumimicrobium sp.]